jgi:RHS repeat-associated protein
VISDVTTYRISALMDRTNGSDMYYYYFAGRRIAMRSSAGVSYLYADNLGSTMVTTGTAISDQRYTPWGRARDASQQAALPYRYTGQREETALGLYDYGARWYDPSIGRFIQADTIVPQPGNPQSLNRYSYALNNPMRYTDPTGMIAEDEQEEAQSILERLWGTFKAKIYLDCGYKNGEWLEGLWELGDLYAIEGAINRLSSFMGSVEAYLSNIGELAITKGGDSAWARNRHINLGSGFSWQYSREFIFIHESAHIWDQNTGSRLSNDLLDQTKGQIVDNHYIPGGQPAITPDPLDPQEDWADSVASYLYPRTAQALAYMHYPQGRGVFMSNYYETQRALIVGQHLGRRIYY